MKHTVLTPSCATVAILSAMAVFSIPSQAAETVLEGISTDGTDADRVKIWHRCDGNSCDFEAILDQQLTDEVVEFKWKFSDGTEVITTDPLASYTWETYGDKDAELSVYSLDCELYYAEAAFTLLIPSPEFDSETDLAAALPDTDNVSDPASPLPSAIEALSSSLVLIGQDAQRLVSEPLQGVNVRGDAYIFIESLPNAKSVFFELTNTASDAIVRQLESTAPYDFAGGSVLKARPFDTRTIADGNYSLDIAATYLNGEKESLSVGFSVSNTPTAPAEPSEPSEPAVGTAQPDDSEQQIPAEGELVYSMSSNRSDGASLDGSILAGNVYMSLLGEESAQSVQFFIDDETLKGSPLRVEKKAPWDFSGGSVSKARSFNTGKLKNGLHVVSARVTENKKTFVVHASFRVAN